MAAPQVTSPRLPSPPPLTEDFIHPKSPISFSEDQARLENASKVDHGASRRIRPGTKAAEMAEGPPVVDLDDIDSSFAYTEHLKALHNAAIHPDPHTVQPIDRPTAARLATPPSGVDNAAWLHELCRFLCQRVNAILVALFADNPPCSSHTCPEMRASEWQYLCAVHDPPKSCCAIDYCCHTLDWAATTLTSVKNFPNYGMGKQLDGSSANQLRQLTNVFRRVYRIFAHAWFQHREMFWHVEHRTGLYVFFKTVCDVYSLIPEDNYTIPPEAEGIEVNEKGEEQGDHPVLLRRETAKKDEEQEEKPEALLGANLAAGNTTKRHRHSPSTGASSVDTVIEEIEEDEGTIELKKAEQADHEAVKVETAENDIPQSDASSSQAEATAAATASDDVEASQPSISKLAAKEQPDAQDVPHEEKKEVPPTSVEPTTSARPVEQEPETAADDKDRTHSAALEGEETTITINSEE